MRFKSFFVYPRFPSSLHHLSELVYNLWWTWNYEAIKLFYRIDAKLFREVGHDPIKLLHRLPERRITALSRDEGFLFELEKVWQAFEEHLSRVKHAKTGIGSSDVIAYLSMEFGIHDTLPFYAGGLGVLAGDFLKCASDLAMPVAGVGLLYRYGYFNQQVTMKGLQEEIFNPFDLHLSPVKDIHDGSGEPVRVTMKIRNEDVHIALRQVAVGSVRLLLLDTDIEDNPPHLRDITRELYVADREKRLQQELVLGVGGVRALARIGINPTVYHLNEGHSAFFILEMLRVLIVEEGLSFNEARTLLRASTVFTTHTPVIAGNEHFKIDLVKKYVAAEVEALGMGFEEFARHGFTGNGDDSFWLPAFAIRFSRRVNGVSLQHRDISRTMWAGLFPHVSPGEIPIGHVTNGVHLSWTSEQINALFTRYLGPGFLRMSVDDPLWERVFEIPDEELWEAHRRNRHLLISYIRKECIGADAPFRGGNAFPRTLSAVLDPDVLTVVFARRFAPYKRPTLILRDKERFARILSSSGRPVQIIFAGKAHPADGLGKEMIREVIQFAKEYEVRERVLFLENYGMKMARYLVWGADLWLNTPVKEMEASGTSGMKAALNGVLNLSTLEGWWREGFNGKNGWAIRAGEFYRNPHFREEAEADHIYRLLEDEISERYYGRGDTGVPDAWVAMMKQSIVSVAREFSMGRMMRDYLRDYYLPSLEESRNMRKEDHRLLKEAVSQEQQVAGYWNGIRLHDFITDVARKHHLDEGEEVRAWCRVDFNGAPAELFRVELFYLHHADTEFTVVSMEPIDGEPGRYGCTFVVQGTGLQHMNVRVKPANPLVEDMHPEFITWRAEEEGTS